MEKGLFDYHRVFHGNTVMVIVPHEDDEINLAGSIIYGAREEGFHVICVFVTNGDWQYPGFIRMHEAIHSLKELGVPEEDVIFLGYPDSASQPERNVYKSGQNEAITVNGRSATYGMKGHPEFAMSFRGKHQSYTWQGLKQDMKDVILQYRPETIITNDFDFHPDHRVTSLAFDDSMKDILTEIPEYTPLVLKGFCYSTAIFAPDDFYAPHLLSTMIDRNGLWNSLLDTDNPAFSWEHRVRLPVWPECRALLAKNVLARSLGCHVSQKTLKTARKVINGDQVFWWKRTNNLAFLGKMSSSSGNCSYLNDFKTMAARDISEEKNPHMGNYLWIPEADDKDKWCRIDFEEPHHVEAVAFYGNIDRDSRILQGKLTFSNGFTYEVNGIKELGQETLISFPPQDDVRWIRFDILETKGTEAGLAEWEILSDTRPPFQLLSICVDDQLAYDWTLWPGETPSVSAYTWGVTDPLIWYCDGKTSNLFEINHKVKELEPSRILKIRVEVKGHPEIYDEVMLKAGTSEDRKKWEKQQKNDKRTMWWTYQKQKWPHHKLKGMKKEEEYKG